MVKYEELLVHIGQFGRWQKLCVCLLWLPPMFAGVHNLLYVFTGPTSIKYIHTRSYSHLSTTNYDNILFYPYRLFHAWPFVQTLINGLLLSDYLSYGCNSYFRTEAKQWVPVSDTRVWWGGFPVCWLLRCDVPEKKGRKSWLLPLLPTKSEI